MDRFDLNPDAIDQFARGAVSSAIAAIDAELDEVRGQPVDTVWPVLVEAMRRHGLDPRTDVPELASMIEVIAAGGHLRT